MVQSSGFPSIQGVIISYPFEDSKKEEVSRREEVIE